MLGIPGLAGSLPLGPLMATATTWATISSAMTTYCLEVVVAF